MASKPNIIPPRGVLKFSTIQIMGSGIGSIPLEDILGILSMLMQAAPVIGFKIATKALPFYCIGEVRSMESNTPPNCFHEDLVSLFVGLRKRCAKRQEASFSDPNSQRVI
jgi:hypothetical protein